MARRVSNPNAYGLSTASGTAASTANIKSSAPRMRSNLFHIAVALPSNLADHRLAEDPGGADGKGENEEDEPRHLAPAAAQREAGDALERSQEHAHHHHAEAGLQAGDDGDRKGLQHQRGCHGRADG